MLTKLFTKVRERGSDIAAVLNAARAQWAQQNLTPGLYRRLAENDVPPPVSDSDNLAIAQQLGIQWSDWRWHARNRVDERDWELIPELFPRYRGQEQELQVYLQNWKMGVMPLNLLLPEAVEKWLPQIGFTPEFDPYHTIRSDTAITRELQPDDYPASVAERFPEKALTYVATVKPGWETALVVTSSSFEDIFCPIGCSNCYRTTRKGGYWKLDNERPLITPKPKQQFEWLVEALNSPEYARVTDVLISGGEPLLFSNKEIAVMLEHLSGAKNIKTVRFCTGALFLGLPFRIDDELLQLCRDWMDQTGKMIPGWNCHLAHYECFTPEAVWAGEKIRSYGFDIMPQIPLESGVNWWPEDEQKSKNCLDDTTQLCQHVLGIRPYYGILDMQGSVPFEQAIRVCGELFDTHHRTNLTRPTSVALFEERNIPLSFHALWAIEKTVHSDKGIVEYRIPRAEGTMAIHTEPLRVGINDDPDSLTNLRAHNV